VLNNLGVFHAARGDLAEAERYFQRALEIDERRRPGIFVAIRLHNLADVALGARDFERAETYLLRALEELERQKEKGELIGRVLYSLGRVRRERKRPEEAAAALRRSLELLANYSPGQKAAAREQLAELLADQQRYDEAESLLLESLEEARKLRTYSASLGDRYQALGRLALRRGRDDDAERHLRTALDHHRRRQPGTTVHAEASHDLGVIARRRGRQEEARALFEEAVTALEAQAGRLGGSEEARTRFRAHFQSYYRDLEELLLDLGRPEEAFETVERSRARALLTLLASRDLALSDGVPAELEKARLEADKRHDRILRALNAADLDDSGRQKLMRELEEARHAQDDVRARIRASAPRAMAFRDPVPLRLDGVKAALEPGTLLLVYSQGDRGARVYAVGPGAGEFTVSQVAATRDALREEVQSFRKAIHDGRGRLGRAALSSRSRRLTDLLLRPLADRVRKARRLVIVPDSPLHLLPFAALRDPSSRERHLVETRPLVVASSATLYDTLTRSASAAVVTATG
jgi:tetratricopeptide (TPR) repeat protein